MIASAPLVSGLERKKNRPKKSQKKKKRAERQIETPQWEKLKEKKQQTGKWNKKKKQTTNDVLSHVDFFVEFFLFFRSFFRVLRTNGETTPLCSSLLLLELETR